PQDSSHPPVPASTACIAAPQFSFGRVGKLTIGLPRARRDTNRSDLRPILRFLAKKRTPDEKCRFGYYHLWYPPVRSWQHSPRTSWNPRNLKTNCGACRKRSLTAPCGWCVPGFSLSIATNKTFWC